MLLQEVRTKTWRQDMTEVTCQGDFAFMIFCLGFGVGCLFCCIDMVLRS